MYSNLQSRGLDGRHAESIRAQPSNVSGSRQGHETRDARASTRSSDGLSLPPPRPRHPGDPGSGFPRTQEADLGAWMFLAPPFEVQACSPSPEQARFLAPKTRGEPKARPADAPPSAARRMAEHGGLGVPNRKVGDIGAPAQAVSGRARCARLNSSLAREDSPWDSRARDSGTIFSSTTIVTPARRCARMGTACPKCRGGTLSRGTFPASITLPTRTGFSSSRRALRASRFP